MRLTGFKPVTWAGGAPPPSRDGLIVRASAKLSGEALGTGGRAEEVEFLMAVESNGTPVNRLYLGFVESPHPQYVLLDQMTETCGAGGADSDMDAPPTFEKPCAMERPALVFDKLHGRLLVAGGGEQGAASVWALDLRRGEWKTISRSLPPMLTDFTMHFDGMRNVAWVMGGAGRAQESGSLWVVDLFGSGAVWERPGPEGLARKAHASVLDELRGKLYVFGGISQGRVLSDLWLYDMHTRQWEQLDTGTGDWKPQGRTRAAMVLDPVSRLFWVSGGERNGRSLWWDRWGYEPVSERWIKQPVGTATRPDGGRTGVIEAGRSMAYLLDGSGYAYPGRLVTISLESQDPCVGLELVDGTGGLINADLQCSAQIKTTAAFLQPDETYVLRIRTLAGFDAPQGSAFSVDIQDAHLAQTDWIDAGGRVIDAETRLDARERRLFVLKRRALEMADLSDPYSVEWEHDTTFRGRARALELSGKSAILTRVGTSADVLVYRADEGLEQVQEGEVRGPGNILHVKNDIAYVAFGKRISRLDLKSGAVTAEVRAGGVVTAMATVSSRYLVVSTLLGEVETYAVDWPDMMSLVDTVTSSAVGIRMAVRGRKVHLSQQKRWRYLFCRNFGLCVWDRDVVVFHVDESGGLSQVANYPDSAWSLPHLRWAAGHALVPDGAGLAVLEAVSQEGE